MEKQLKRRIYFFIIIVVICGWIGKIIDMVLVNQPKGQSLGSLVFLITPLIAALLLSHIHNSKWKSLGFKPNIKGKVNWYLMSLLIFPLSFIVLFILGIMTGGVDCSSFQMSGFINSLLVWFIYNFFRCILEEGAWRGFLTERLLKLKVNDWLIYVITWLVWSTWHIPYYLFFYHASNSWQMIGSLYFLLFSWTILFTEIYRLTKSIWPCVLMHAVSNAIQYTMLNQYLIINKKWSLWIDPTNGILACMLCILAGLFIRKYRINHEK